MKCVDFLKIKKTLNPKDEITFAIIEGQVREGFSSEKTANELITQVCDILYDAYKENFIVFMRDILFQHQLTIRKTVDNEKAIKETFEKAKSMSAGIQQQRELVDVYRHMVADVFDPYLSLLVACLQLKEQKFESYLAANIGAGEFNKYEYVLSQIKPTRLFDGYNSIIRNAASHTGSESIVYEGDTIVFRNIKRGKTPKVEGIRITSDEIIQKIVGLNDFVQAVVVAVNILGLDAEDVILQEETLSNEFLDLLASKELRSHLQQRLDEKIHRIWIDERISEDEKVKALSQWFFLECEKRNMSVINVSFDRKRKAVKIQVPEEIVERKDNDALVSRIVKLLRYGIVAEPFFRNIVDEYRIAELAQGQNRQITILASGKEYRDYSKETSGIYDLLNDTGIYWNKERLAIKVDFEQLSELEVISLGRVFPRKKRP